MILNKVKKNTLENFWNNKKCNRQKHLNSNWDNNKFLIYNFKI